LNRQKNEDFHEARKAVKALLGAVGFLPADTISIDPHYEKLAELLGDENDLATLSDWLEAHGFSQRFVPDLWLTLDHAIQKLRRHVIRDLAKLSPVNLE
jgi:hypothetical protein